MMPKIRKIDVVSAERREVATANLTNSKTTKIRKIVLNSLKSVKTKKKLKTKIQMNSGDQNSKLMRPSWLTSSEIALKQLT